MPVMADEEVEEEDPASVARAGAAGLAVVAGEVVGQEPVEYRVMLWPELGDEQMLLGPQS